MTLQFGPVEQHTDAIQHYYFTPSCGTVETLVATCAIGWNGTPVGKLSKFTYENGVEGTCVCYRADLDNNGILIAGDRDVLLQAIARKLAGVDIHRKV
jgi:hypothetical protein